MRTLLGGALRRLFVLAASVSFAWSAHAATSPVGAIAGSSQVTPTGAFTYSIPLAVPPGTAGMQPNLSLTYNSQGGNGLIGMGWSLSGLSVIHRCPKTLVQDGVKGGINLDTNDRFCLDSQRLVAISGSYGGAGTEYRTETESYSRIVSYGAQGSGPAYWQVWTKSGQIMEYGVTNDSRIEAQGKTEVMLWAVDKVSDTVGNYLTVSYTESNANGQYYPARIDYAGNANTGKAPNASVKFIYEVRPDVVPAYVAGSLVQTPLRLSHISTYAGATLMRDYGLTYEQGTATSRSRIASIQECAGDGTCLAPTTIAWSDFPPQFSAPTVWGSKGPYAPEKFSLGDFNGDGKSDLVHHYWVDVQTSYVYVGISTGAALNVPELWAQINNSTWWTTVSSCTTGAMDLDSDGRADLLTFCSGPPLAVRALSTGSALQGVAMKQYNARFGGPPQQLRAADVNGDSRIDVMYYDQQYNGSYGTNQILYCNPDLPPWTCGTSWITLTTLDPSQVNYADMNGDGMADLIVQTSSNQFQVGLSTGTAFQPLVQWGQQTGSYVAGQAQYADVNGDGKADLVFQDSNNIFWVSLSTGTQFLAPAQWAQRSGTFVAGQAQYVDVNGDGKADLIFQDNNNQFWVALSTGTGFTTPTSWAQLSGSFAAATAKYGDFNGDGKADLLFIDTSSQFWVALSQGAQPDVVTTITTGLGATTTVTYKPLTDSSVYTKGSGAAYPYVDVQFPMYVVSNVSTSDGVGGNYATDYTYAGAKAHQQGGGFLGFAQVTAHDPQAGLRTTTTYRQDYPYQGLPLSVQKVTDTLVPLNQVTHTYTDQLLNVALSPVYHQALVTQKVESSYELNGGLVTTVTTQSQYDGYGNPTSIVVSTGDGYGKTTTNTYDNIIDASHWFLGRLRRSSVTSVTP